MKSTSNRSRFFRQRGSITLMGAGAIISALYAFSLVMEYSKLKIIDHELDNYARSIAETALRSEMALTLKGYQEGSMDLQVSDYLSESVLHTLGYNSDEAPSDRVIYKELTYGRIEADGAFYALGDDNPYYSASSTLTTYRNNPRLALQEIASGDMTPENLPKFNAVAVQLWTNDNFLNLYTPEGRAIFGADPSNQKCYCDIRYEMCMNGDLSKQDILDGLYPKDIEKLKNQGVVKVLLNGLLDFAAIPAHSLTEAQADALAEAIADPTSEARRNYCEYGFTATHPNLSDTSKYPYIDFFKRQGWIGIEPFVENNGVIGNLLVESNFSKGDYLRAVGQLPVFVYDGADTLANDAGLVTTVDELLVLLNPLSGDGSMHPQSTTGDNLQKEDLLATTFNGQGYRCSLLTVNVDVTLLNWLTDFLGLSNQVLAMRCDNLLNSLLTVVDSIVDPILWLVLKILPLDLLLNWLLENILGFGPLGDALMNLLDPDVVVHDPIYIGRSGTCIYGTDTDNLSSQRCLYNANDGAYQSCNYLLSAEDESGLPKIEAPNLVNRLSIFLFGPVKDFSAGVESLNCEMRYLRYSPTNRWGLGSGGWKEIN
ncbi:hypothetical protein [Thiomicrorhabdus sp. 6S3-12]|uniref:hypothetical protein n=1 Tax=Thiomicrorhabdus sp. 6S3-12 TaxID=2819681 RepID=UPI001AAD352D|nr:hypothetical protein [Thiomicrorhabdus sp. 6S3-12]MBO1923376.1 hypothetical protein [Thiomicrorhabdus sp. 6S3-12]